MEQKKKKRTGLVIALVACLALVGVAGVMAWYSSTSEITNNFVNGKNNFTSGAHFTLNDGWKAVEATQYKGQANEYTGGLFVYEGKGTSVNIDADAVLGDNKSIKVSAYLVAASNKTEQIDVAEITEAAKAWAQKR